MRIIVDYRCDHCAGLAEHVVPAPAPPSRPCPACGRQARRLFGAGGLIGRAAATPTSRPAPSCLDHPNIPMLCHLPPPAARALVARAKGDNRALDRELADQTATRARGERLPTVTADHQTGGGDGPASAVPGAPGDASP